MNDQPTHRTGRDWRSRPAGVAPSDWTVVIAAAGKGSRLDYGLPKILFPVAGRPILEWLLDLVVPICETAVFVLSPDGRDSVVPVLDRLIPGRYKIAIQPHPSGMGDAVQIGAEQASTLHTAVMWGDQVALRPESMAVVARLHAGPLCPHATVPTVFRNAPYVHFERHPDGRIARVLQAREGDAMPARGESDTGFFCFQTQVLRRLLVECKEQAGARGSRTAEFNLLPVIPFAAATGRTVLTPHVMDVEETIGINTRADAERVEAFLRRSCAFERQIHTSCAGQEKQ
jgi:bifunctional UDP-N-acetylglucosamine pyrophosphorylase/glucosamine-1-phosphate N-acetyltransferase